METIHGEDEDSWRVEPLGHAVFVGFQGSELEGSGINKCVLETGQLYSAIAVFRQTG